MWDSFKWTLLIILIVVIIVLFFILFIYAVPVSLYIIIIIIIIIIINAFETRVARICSRGVDLGRILECQEVMQRKLVQSA